MSEPLDQLDGLWFQLEDRALVEAALRDEADDDGFHAIAPDQLSPYGRWLQGEEDPTGSGSAHAPHGDHDDNQTGEGDVVHANRGVDVDAAEQRLPFETLVVDPGAHPEVVVEEIAGGREREPERAHRKEEPALA